LQPKINFSIASAEGRAGNRDKEQDRDDNRNGRSPRGLLFSKMKINILDSRSNSRRRSPEGGRDRSGSPKGNSGENSQVCQLNFNRKRALYRKLES